MHCVYKNQSIFFHDPDNSGSETKEKKNENHAILLQKGLKSFENPVL